MKKEIECNIKGRVQMVMFRDFVKRNSESLDLVGEVKNLNDGSVYVIAQGDEEKLNELMIKLNKGSLLSKVDNIETTWKEPSKEFSGFNIIF